MLNDASGDAPSALMTWFIVGASAICKHPPMSTESAAATFLRACAVQNSLSTKTTSIIQRRYFARIDGGSVTEVWITANGFDPRHYLKHSSGNYELRIVLATNDGPQT